MPPPMSDPLRIHRIVEDCKILQANGVGIIAVMSNDVNDPKYGHEDSFDNMQVFANDNLFSFPYVYDETQEVGPFVDDKFHVKIEMTFKRLCFSVLLMPCRCTSSFGKRFYRLL